MLVIQLLLPRFLVVEIVFFFHFMQESHPSLSNLIVQKVMKAKLEMEYVVPVGKCNPEDEFLFCNSEWSMFHEFPYKLLTNYIIIDSKATCLGSQCQHSGPKISKTTTEYHKQDVNITLRYHVASSKAEYNASQKSVSSCYKRQIHQIFGPSEKSRFTVYQQIPNCNKGAKFHHRLDMQDSYKSFSFGFATTS
jgi:hypothetical protein